MVDSLRSIDTLADCHLQSRTLVVRLSSTEQIVQNFPSGTPNSPRIPAMTTTTPPDTRPSPSPTPPSGDPYTDVERQLADDSVWARLGSYSFRRRWFVLGTWIAILVTVFAAVGTFGASTDSSFESPDSDSQLGFDILSENFGGSGSFLSGSVVFEAEQGVDRRRRRRRDGGGLRRGRRDRRGHPHQPVLADRTGPGPRLRRRHDRLRPHRHRGGHRGDQGERDRLGDRGDHRGRRRSPACASRSAAPRCPSSNRPSPSSSASRSRSSS